MKIFDEKNSKVYVQISDLLYLHKRKYNILDSIKAKVYFDNSTYIDAYSFLEFNKKEEIEYFRNLDFILNYSDYCDIEQDELIDRITNLEKEIEYYRKEIMEKIIIEYNHNVGSSPNENDILVNKLISKEFLFNSLSELLFMKRNNSMPIFKKSNEAVYQEDIYQIKSAIRNNEFIICKEDNSKMDEFDIIPSGFCQRGLNFLLEGENIKYTYQNKMEDDNKKMVITLILEKEKPKSKVLKKIFKLS